MLSIVKHKLTAPIISLTLSCTIFYLLFLGVHADEISYSDVIEERSTNWSDTLSVPQFDPNLGELQEVQIQLEGSVNGVVLYENLGPLAAPITMTHSATISVDLPNSVLIASAPSAVFTDTVSAFDGIRDNDGASGNRIKIAHSDQVVRAISTTAEMAPYIGTASLVLPADALGTASADGPGNFSGIVQTNAAGAVLNIRYRFRVPNIDIETFTNGNQADGANDVDVPIIAVDNPVVWTYEVKNTGAIPFALAELMVTDSVTGVVPVFDPSSDDGDLVLSPGETWTYRFTSTTLDLANPPAGTPLEPGCDPTNTSFTRPTYINVGTVVVEQYNLVDTDPTHHCNPANPDVTIEKRINGADADLNTDPDVPILAPGTSINWVYDVENIGQVAISLADLRVTDSDPAVTPQLLTTSDQNSDLILSPGETWTYVANGTAQNLSRPEPGTMIIQGCGQDTTNADQRVYQNAASVVAFGETDADLAHYCNPRNTTLTIQKLTNGPGQTPQDADDPNGADVPLLVPGQPVTWTYQVQNTGQVSVTLSDVMVTDDQPGIIPIFDPGSDANNDGLLAPGETWLYRATGTAQYLEQPSAGVTTVEGCNPGGTELPRPAYENVGTVTLGDTSVSDPSHYCNVPDPRIELEKLTNNIDADQANAPDIPQLAPGGQITWTYIVRNVGNVPFAAADVSVTDDQPGVTPLLNAGSDDGDGILSPGEVWFYEASGTAADLTAPNPGTTIVTGCDPGGLGQTRPTYENVGTAVAGTATAQDPSHYCNEPDPGLLIEKATNGADADSAQDPFVPELAVGQRITWTYQVLNTGNVAFAFDAVEVQDSDPTVTIEWLAESDDDDDLLLSPGEVWRYRAIGSAQDLLNPAATTVIVDGCAPGSTGRPRPTYENIASIRSGIVGDADASHYCNAPRPNLIITKLTNNIDVENANAPNVPKILPGDLVEWSYIVTNTGNVAFGLAEIRVTDSQPGVIPVFDPASDENADRQLSPGESWLYRAAGLAQDLEQPDPGVTVVDGCDPDNTGVARPTYQNIGTVESGNVADSDPSFYCNYDPGIEIKKLTNGFDADAPSNIDVPVLVPGTIVTWTYLVTNTGDLPFAATEVEVIDSDTRVTPQLDTTSDSGSDQILSPNETWHYTASRTVEDLAQASVDLVPIPGCTVGGTEQARPTYENVGAVLAKTETAQDKSHYCNPPLPGIAINKLTNGADADGANDADVPILVPGSIVTWTYIITNTGNLTYALTDLTVSDSDPNITPTLVTSSDAGGDGILSPGEHWIYVASLIVENLLTPSVGIVPVAGCSAGGTTDMRPTYENIGTVRVRDETAEDPSHYCNPSVPGITIQKLTNGPGQQPADADNANGGDVPLIERSVPNETIMVTWTYLVTNTGNTIIPLADIQVTDDDPSLTLVRDTSSDDNGDQLLFPGESCTYRATAPLLDLDALNRNGDPRIVSGCNQFGDDRSILAYLNVGSVQAGNLEAQDPSHYCSPPPTAINGPIEEPSAKQKNQTIYLPIVLGERL